MRLRRLLIAIAFLASALPLSAWAQGGGAPCPIGAPVTITSSAPLTLTTAMQCAVLIFTSRSSVAVTMPTANTLAPGYQAMLLSTGGGVTLTTVSPLNNGVPGTIALGQGQSAIVMTDGTGVWVDLGSPFLAAASSGNAFSNYSTVFPGTFQTDSPKVLMPDGVLQITNRPSVLPSAVADVCKNLPFNTPLSPGRLSFWSILDPTGNPKMIPLCG